MPTTLKLIGRPHAVHAGAVVEMPAERRWQLLALLAVRHTWVPRPEVAAMFWPDHRHDLAASNLRKVVHRARELPCAAALEVQAGALRFAVGTDLQELERAMREGRVVEALGWCAGGELLDGLDDGASEAWTAWLDSERTVHARRVQELTRSRLRQLEAEPAEAALWARRLLAADPFDEDAVVALLSAQRALGRVDEQREAYRSYALRLEEEFAVEPSARVRRLVEPAASPTAGGAVESATVPHFFGRSRELAQLAGLLARSECRLVTVTGPGGVGKSSLLKQVLRQLEPRFADGSHWIALDDLHDTAQVVARIAAELRLTPDPQQPALARVCAHLESRQVLLVFDNGEHLADLAQLAERLLGHAAPSKICVTSRARLGAPGEWLLPLAGLSLPPPQAAPPELLASDAAQLFVAAAAAAQPGFDAAAQAPAIGTLLRATGGMPLAILLAAHWVRLLPVAEIVDELERSIDVLDSGGEGEERPEHRSMRATFERSWQMLATREQRSLAALSVFVGTFTRQAAHEVAEAALPLLAALADKSLLQMLPGGRCSLHPLIRQFAAGKLDAGEATAAARRHALWYHGLLVRLAAEGDDATACDAVQTELENCRLAWRWAVAQHAFAALADSTPTLLRFFELRGRAEEGVTLLREALPVAAAHPAPAAELLSAIAQLQYRQYRLDDAVIGARQGLQAARSAAHPGARLRCLLVLGLSHHRRGHDREARRFLEQALRQARSNNDTRAVVFVLGLLATADMHLGRYDSAGATMLDVLARQRELGDWLGVASRLNSLAHLHQLLGDWPRQRAYLDEALAVCTQHGIASLRPHVLFNLANGCFIAGEIDASEHAARLARDEARATGNRGVEATALLQLVRIAVRRGDIATARGGLHDAIGRIDALGSAPMQLDAMFCFAELVAAEGDRRRAAGLLRAYIARPEVDGGDRTIALSVLDGLGVAAEAAETTGEPMPLDALLRRLLEETAPR